MNAIPPSHEGLHSPHVVQPLADTARLAAIARILGMSPAPPEGARVLDIGCGTGSHLLALAARSPDGRFLGIDVAGPDIDSARALAAQAGLANVRFEQADLMAWTPPPEPFDYVIADGFFSWVPDAVKARLLSVTAACLAPQGVACIRYATYPGNKQQDALRDLLRLRTDDLASADDRVALAHATLDLLDRAWERAPQLPHAGFMRDTVHRIRRKTPGALLRDDLGGERDPCYLLQFATWAAEHGLRYLADSEFHTMLLENLPPESARELAALGLDRLQTEQMIDYISNRSSRCSLLVGAQATMAPGLVADALRGLALGPAIFPVDAALPGAATEALFENEHGTSVTLRSLPLVAFARALAAHRGELMPYARLLSEAQALAGVAIDDAQQARLCEDLLQLYGQNHLRLSARAFEAPARLPAKPRLAPFQAAHARERALLVAPGLEAIVLSPANQAFCALLDGSRSQADLAALVQDGRGGELEDFLRTLNRLGCLVRE